MLITCYGCGDKSDHKTMHACRECKHVYCVHCYIQQHKHDYAKAVIAQLESILNQFEKA